VASRDTVTRRLGQIATVGNLLTARGAVVFWRKWALVVRAHRGYERQPPSQVSAVAPVYHNAVTAEGPSRHPKREPRQWG